MRTAALVVVAASLCSPSTSSTAPEASKEPVQDAVDTVLGSQPDQQCLSEDDVPASSHGAFAEELVAGDFHTCARLRSGIVRCWGTNASSELGTCEASEAIALPRAIAPEDGALAVAAGNHATCWLSGSGDLHCSAVMRKILGATGPGPVAGVGDGRAVSVGDQHACVVRRSGLPVCFGHWTAVEALGSRAKTADEGTDAGRGAGEIDVPGATAVIAGSAHSCALDGQGQVSCWGRNTQGQLGDPRLAADLDDTLGTIRRVPGLPRIDDIASSGDTTCALSEAGEVFCWGQTFGSAKQLAMPEAVDVDVGPNFVCAVTSNGAVVCDGLVPAGLGQGMQGALEVAVGQSHLCIRKQDGTVWCQGDNSRGQLGRGEVGGGSATPQPVLLDGVPL